MGKKKGTSLPSQGGRAFWATGSGAAGGGGVQAVLSRREPSKENQRSRTDSCGKLKFPEQQGFVGGRVLGP